VTTMGWIEKQILKRWIKELRLNIDVFRRNAKAYIDEGGFKEVKETLRKFRVDLEIPSELMEEGRRLELEYARVASELADKYEQLLRYIEKEVK